MTTEKERKENARKGSKRRQRKYNTNKLKRCDDR